MTRDEAKEYFERQLGATIQGTVTKQTDMVIVGGDPGRVKIAKAQQYSIPVIPWESFVATGLADVRGNYDTNRTPHDRELLVSLLLHMVAGVDNVTAYYSAAGDRRLWRAVEYGYRAIEYVLQSAWGPGFEDYNPGSEDDPIDSGLSGEQCLRQAVGEWAMMIAVLTGDEKTEARFTR